MEKLWNVQGFKIVSYDRKSDGKHVSGVEVYLLKEVPDTNVSGVQYLVVYLNDDYATYSPCLNDTVRLIYNRYGKVEDLIVV